MRSKPNHQIQVESIEKAIACLVGEQDRIRSEAQTAIDALRKVCAAAQPIDEDDMEPPKDNEWRILSPVSFEVKK